MNLQSGNLKIPRLRGSAPPPHAPAPEARSLRECLGITLPGQGALRSLPRELSLPERSLH
jgi:hypothetical protein